MGVVAVRREPYAQMIHVRIADMTFFLNVRKVLVNRGWDVPP
jgi:hypothetical protein